VLRSCCSLEAFRRTHLADMDANQIASFLILQPSYPRSLRFCVERLHSAIAGVRISNNVHTPSAPERIVGRLGASLEYAGIDEIMAEGLSTYLQNLQNTANEASTALQKAYFLY
jgi:uncharacterized alpha-E superfamily protein